MILYSFQFSGRYCWLCGYLHVYGSFAIIFWRPPRASGPGYPLQVRPARKAGALRAFRCYPWPEGGQLMWYAHNCFSALYHPDIAALVTPPLEGGE
jgi:hypothetical protein